MFTWDNLNLVPSGSRHILHLVSVMSFFYVFINSTVYGTIHRLRVSLCESCFSFPWTTVSPLMENTLAFEVVNFFRQLDERTSDPMAEMETGFWTCLKPLLVERLQTFYNLITHQLLPSGDMALTWGLTVHFKCSSMWARICKHVPQSHM